MRKAAAFLVVLACSADGPLGSTREAIEGGVLASDYPEAVVVTSDGFIPCSGVLLSPNVVLSAGHCRGTGASFVVSAPFVETQATASSSWSPFDDDPATSPDVLLIYLDSPITLTSYPTLMTTEALPGTAVVDIGRVLNGSIDTTNYKSPTVFLQGDAAALGFPFNYEALPDISQTGDSGGPIMLAGTHTVAAIVDTDTVEQNIPETVPIDLFARIDVVASVIQQKVADAASFGTTLSTPRRRLHHELEPAEPPTRGSSRSRIAARPRWSRRRGCSSRRTCRRRRPRAAWLCWAAIFRHPSPVDGDLLHEPRRTPAREVDERAVGGHVAEAPVGEARVGVARGGVEGLHCAAVGRDDVDVHRRG